MAASASGRAPSERRSGRSRRQDLARVMLAQPAGQLQSAPLVTPLLHRLPSHSAALVVWSRSEKLVRTTLASPPLLCAALGLNLFPVRTHTSAIHGRLLQVRRAVKPRGSQKVTQKEAGSAALRHSDHCFLCYLGWLKTSRHRTRHMSQAAALPATCRPTSTPNPVL